MTDITQDRFHELEVWVYLKELYATLLHDGCKITDHYSRAVWVADCYNRYLIAMSLPEISIQVADLILRYYNVERWELVTFFTRLGYSVKQIADIMGITAKTVSNTLYKNNYSQNPKTLQRWLDINETVNDLHGMRQTTKTAQLIVPSRKLAGLLRESV